MEVAIFCKVIDNFGDAGFCLRLARGLSNKVKIVRVYCDNTALLKKLHTFCKHNNHSMPKNLIVCKYDSEFQLGEIVSLSLVVEAFQAEPPIDFLRKIDNLGGVTRVILDHLVTDMRMDSFQNKLAPDYKLLNYFVGCGWENSPSANRRWIAPGFSAMSAGLISNGWRKINSCVREQLRNEILKSKDTKIKKNYSISMGRVFIVCAFLYEMNDFFLQCPVPKGFDSLALWVPKSIVMNQVDFDCALQSCDFNYVRGEDSFLSAHNAAASQWKVPFVWQPYFEKNKGHVRKFEGWKKIFPEDKFRSYLEFATLVATRKNSDFVDKWKKLICEWHLFRINFHTYCLEVVNQKSLEQSLLNCTKK